MQRITLLLPSHGLGTRDSVGIFGEHYLWSGIAAIDRRQSNAAREITNSNHGFCLLWVNEYESLPSADTGEIEDVVGSSQRSGDDERHSKRRCTAT